jgi:hypothetical protein
MKTTMEINGKLIAQIDVKGTIFYKLSDICKALKLDLIESINYLEAQKQTRPLLAGGDAWISMKALHYWMLVPDIGKLMSPEAVEFGRELLADNTL